MIDKLMYFPDDDTQIALSVYQQLKGLSTQLNEPIEFNKSPQSSKANE